MKKNIISHILLLSIILFSAGCENFDRLNTNNDTPTQATAELMATSLLWNIAKPASAKTFSYDFIRSKYMGWQEGASDEQYNYFGRLNFEYDILTTGQKMMDKSANTIYEDAFKGLFYFVKAYKIFHLTLKVGDVPYSESLKGEQGIFKPKYDLQKEVLIQVLRDLDLSYELFSNFKALGKTFGGDIIYNGDASKWLKAISTLQMKVLINASIQENDQDLNIKEHFKKVFNNQSRFESNEDNFQLVYKNQTGMINPFHHTQTKHSVYILLSDMLVDSLKKYEDYRLFYYASPAQAMIDSGMPYSSWDAFAGVDITLPFSEMGAIGAEGMCSQLNEKYTQREEGAPFAKMRYTDMNFYLAEAALRGWINDDPSKYYLEGIKSDLMFQAKYTPNEAQFNYGRVIDDAYINNYLSSKSIQLIGNFEVDLNKILTQKYLANFLQVYELDGYMDYRRTGYPKLPINPKTNMNPKTDRIPVRFMYPSSELDYNSENVMEAIQRQFSGNDEVNELMWILKKN